MIKVRALAATAYAAAVAACSGVFAVSLDFSHGETLVAMAGGLVIGAAQALWWLRRKDG